MLHRQIALEDCEIHVARTGSSNGPTIVLVHGWPEDWSSWSKVIEYASSGYDVVAVDLPGVGKSRTASPDGRKTHLARQLRALIQKLELRDVTLVGHDVGGMVTYAYLRLFPDLRRAVILDTVIPGLDPWEEVRRNPHIWHFAFHAVPRLPELLVAGHERDYFEFFYEALAVRKAAIPTEARERYAAAYRSAEALRQGFELYRAFGADADENRAFSDGVFGVETPVLYVRGAGETGKIEQYLEGLRAAGVRRLSGAVIPEAGHFAPEEAPAEVWAAIERFLRQES